MGGRFPKWNPLDRKPEPDVELRIVPVQTAVPAKGIRAVVLWKLNSSKSNRYDFRAEYSTPAPIMATADAIQGEDQTAWWSVCDELYPKVQDSNKTEPKPRDVIEVVLQRGHAPAH